MTAADWTCLPLAGDGRSVVEASAGTGKTWTIAVVYLRVLLERKLLPEHIIVGTFTNAAAAELSERLRARLRWALAEAARFSGQMPMSDAPADQAWLQKRWCDNPASHAEDTRRLQAALSRFDAAPVGTLHNLCSRILADYPFAAAVPFRKPELVNGKSVHADLATDLWRVIDQGKADDALVRLAQAARVTRATLNLHVPALLQTNVRAEAIDDAAVLAPLSAIVGDLDAWAQTIDTVIETPGLLKSNAKLLTAWRAVRDALRTKADGLAGVIATHADTLGGARALTGVTNSGKEHAGLLALADQSTALIEQIDPIILDRASDPALRQFLHAAQHWCRRALAARLAAQNQSTFDALIETVHRAIQPIDHQRPLADALHAAWPVALVDEFQDTDPLQYAILDAIYRDAEGAPRGRWVMIGDPKQAIYRFRGGDIQTYRRAVEGVGLDDRLTLDTNYRSSRAYVAGVNAFYRLTGNRLAPIGSPRPLAYHAVGASARRDAEPLSCRATQTTLERPLVLHVLAPDNPAEDLELAALRSCAGEIVHALSPQGYRIGEAALRPAQIAVLLPSHAQIARLKRMLQARGVPCVTRSPSSVFSSTSARALRLVLHAVVHPDDPSAVRAALVTALCGFDLAAIEALQTDTHAWEREAERFARWHARLSERGPLAIVAQLIEQHATRLLSHVEGERMLTDLRHLGELLQAEWDAGLHGEQLLAWFFDQEEAGNEDADGPGDLSLRLESDTGRVQLMTLHASKGLEFPVVFLPLMWRHKARTTAQVKLLARAEGIEKDIVLGAAKALVAQQETEERHRILYVALTRAIHACHVHCLPMRTGATDIIEKAKRATDVVLNDLTATLLQHDSGDEAIELRHDWNPWPGARHVESTPALAALHARAMPPALTGPLPMRHSFSTLSQAAYRPLAVEDAAADDESLVAESMADVADPLQASVPIEHASRTPHPELDALAMTAGPSFGNAVHDIFEHRTPDIPLHSQHGLIQRALAQHGVMPGEGSLEAFVEVLATRLQRVLDTPLDRHHGPRLMDLPAQALRAEMEFNYALEPTQLAHLREACARHGESDLLPTQDATLLGLMNGKIDLVFEHAGRVHVLDWKTNRLGSASEPTLDDYAPSALDTAMHEHRYRLQALLYTVAVERYLRERLGAHYRRAQHLGDCWYLFVRATGLSLPDGRACGVWHHRFPDALLDAVQAVLGARP